jgi:hypothetical protein
MTTTDTLAKNAPSRIPLVAALSFAVSAVLTAVGTFTDLSGSDDNSGSDAGAYLTVLGITAVLTALVFGLLVRTARGEGAGTRSAILGSLSVLSLLAFWSGAPVVFAGGAIGTALVERDHTAHLGRGAKAGLTLACLATLTAVALAVIG